LRAADFFVPDDEPPAGVIVQSLLRCPTALLHIRQSRADIDLRSRAP